MSLVTAVITHLAAEQVHAGAALLRTLAPDARLVICYGGPRSEFERLAVDEKVFIDDPTLKSNGPHLQSMTQVFEAVWEACFIDDDDADSLYVIEYDHLVLDGAFEGHLRDLAEKTHADLLGKQCIDCSATNHEHYIRFRRDPRLLDHLRRISVREETTRLFSCLGNGIWVTRRALEAYVAVERHPPCYLEIYVPTLLHHLGFHVVNIDAHSDMYRHVRWLPPITVAEVIEGLGRGTIFMHPVKDQGAVDAVMNVLAERASVRPA
jgi:hypothetical protein